MKETKSKLILLYFLLLITAVALLMPKSIGGAYQANMLPNIYLPDIGLDSHIGENPRSIIAYIALIRILYLVCNTDLLTTIRIAGFFSVLVIICSYLLISHVLPGNKSAKILIACAYPIVLLGLNTSILRGYIFSFTIPLGFTILFFLLSQQKNYNYIPTFLVALFSWIALGFFWHSFHVLIYIIILVYIIIFNLSNIIKTGETAIKWNLPLLITVIFIVTWMYLRMSMIAFTSENLYIDLALSSIFGKGSFAGVYSFRSTLPIDYVDGIRYIGYLIVYVIMGIIAIQFGANTFRGMESPPIYTLITIFLVSDVIFQSAYFIASGSAGPMILLLFSYPILLIFLNNKSESKMGFLNKSIFRKILTMFLVISILITSVAGLCAYSMEEPEKNLDMDMYKNSFYWITEHAHQNIIVSDTHTTGHYQILYAQSGIYKFHEIDIISINYEKYEEILNGEYKSRYDAILVLNVKLYDKHLVFGSLEDWNKFEPLSPQYVTQNRELNMIYDDGNLLIAA